jgi:hypothetical protein
VHIAVKTIVHGSALRDTSQISSLLAPYVGLEIMVQDTGMPLFPFPYGKRSKEQTSFKHPKSKPV